MTKKLLIASRISGVEQLSERVRLFTVEPVHRSTYPTAIPGSHVLVRHERGLLRSYSLCGDDPFDRTYQFAVLRDDAGKGGSVAFHRTAVGDPLHVSYPVPSLRLDEHAAEHVFLAGGIGVTPFPPLAREASRRGLPTTIHYAVRTEADAAFLDLLRDVPGLRIVLHVSERGDRVDVSALVRSLGPEAHLSVCGPDRLLHAVESAVAAHPEADLANRVHLESFSGLDETAARSGDPFPVRLALSGRDIDVRSDQSLLQALRENDVLVDSSCEGGVCGACRVTLLDGDAVHRDACMTPDERRQNIITCVSRGNGRLTLHL